MNLLRIASLRYACNFPVYAVIKTFSGPWKNATNYYRILNCNLSIRVRFSSATIPVPVLSWRFSTLSDPYNSGPPREVGGIFGFFVFFFFFSISYNYLFAFFLYVPLNIPPTQVVRYADDGDPASMGTPDTCNDAGETFPSHHYARAHHSNGKRRICISPGCLAPGVVIDGASLA